MRYLLLTLPCLFACSPADEDTQKQSVPATPAVSGVSTSTSDGAKPPNTQQMGEEMAQALANSVGESMQAAFDEQAAIYAQGGTPEEIAQGRELYTATETIPESDFLSSFVVSESTDGRSCMEVLHSLAENAGMGLDTTSFGDGAVEPPDFEIQGMSKIGAVERIAAQIGLVPVYPEAYTWGDESSTLSFTKEPRTTPTTLAGPFLIQVGQLDEQPPHAVGTLQLTAHAIGMPEAALLANDSMFETFTIGEVQSNVGEDLRSRPDMRRLSTPQCNGSMVTISSEVELKGLLANISSIDSVDGILRIKRPSNVTDLSFESLSPGLRKVGGFSVTLKEVGTNTSMKVRTDSDADVVVAWAPDKINGDPLGILNSNSFGFDKTIDANMTTPETPHQLAAKLVETEPWEVPFELTGISFTRASEQPTEIAALEFDHAQPVSVVFVEFKDRTADFPEVLLRTVSHANKDARTLHIKMIYLNDDNKEIKNSFTSLTPGYNMEPKVPKPFVKAGAIETTTQPAFFMPEETVSVQISVREVEFMDGSVWKADD